MSCGMASIEDIQDAVEACYRQNNKQIVLLKCCSQYPAMYEDMNISVISDMKERFGLPVGLSDHSMGSLAAVVAVSLGAQVVEKHVCLNKKLEESVDSGFSMEFEDYQKMVEDVKNAVIIKGKPTYELTEREKNGLKGRRSLFAIKDIKKGEAFTKENVKSIRPSNGIKPKYYKELLTKNSKKDYEFGEPIGINEIN